MNSPKHIFLKPVLLTHIYHPPPMSVSELLINLGYVETYLIGEHLTSTVHEHSIVIVKDYCAVIINVNEDHLLKSLL
jgi:protein-arginine kinase